jgi:hypothetical protein
MTPNLALIRIEPESTWLPTIPLPLFLLWIPGILLAPLVLLVLWIACLMFGLRFWRTVRMLWELLCSLPGTQVRVTAEGKNINVRIL